MGSQLVVVVTTPNEDRSSRIAAAVRAALGPDVRVSDPRQEPRPDTAEPCIELFDEDLPWSTVARRLEAPVGGRCRRAVVSERDQLLARELATSVDADQTGWTPLPALLEALRGALLRPGGSTLAEPQANGPKEFLSRMSHELRTPLNAILGFAQLLELDDLTPDQKESVDHIVTAGRHLLALVNETLDISRIETGRMHFSLIPIVVTDAVEQVFERLRSEALHAGVSLECAISESTVLADRERLSQVLFHLIANGIRYNRADGSLVVDVRPQPGHRTRIVVRDTGIGIAPDQLPRLFEPFDRLGADRGKVPGTGLGLTLTKRLVEAMGGEIGVESEPGKGSRFWVDLASAAPARNQYEPAGSASSLPSGLGRVLCVEDDDSSLAFIARLLGNEPGTTLIKAGSVVEARRLAATQRPDLVLLDLNLPDGNGEAVIEALRSDPQGAKVPFIVMSGDASPARRARVLGLGVVAYLTKPLDVGSLANALANCVNVQPEGR